MNKKNSTSMTSLEKYAELDFERQTRCGFPEFIYGESKTVPQIVGIMRELNRKKLPVLATRINPDVAAEVCRAIPEAEYEEAGRTLCIRTHLKSRGRKVMVICAGTSDLPAAMEAKVTAELCGLEVDFAADCGVAGLHRLLAKLPRLNSAEALIAVAGMEGALPSVAAGLVSVPVIAVPTSVGYGTSFNGVTALLAMLNSCASGVTVVNIDNGFGAACAAARMLPPRHVKRGS